MLHFKPKLYTLEDPDSINDLADPNSIALTDLMLICGVYRLFTRKDVLELLRRAQLMFPEQDMAENFLSSSSLLEYYLDDVRYELDFEALRAHVGFEIMKFPDNHLSYEDWIAKGASYQMPSVHRAHFLEESYISQFEVDYDFFLRWLEPVVEEDNLKRIDFLLEAVSAELPESLFETVKKSIEENNLSQGFEEPVFNFEVLPKEKQEILWNHFWPTLEHFNDPYERQCVIDKLYFGWLWANDFIEEFQGHLPLVDSRISDFFYEFYIIDDNDFLFEEIIEQDCIEELLPLLRDSKVVEMAKKEKKTWGMDFLTDGL